MGHVSGTQKVMGDYMCWPVIGQNYVIAMAAQYVTDTDQCI